MKVKKDGFPVFSFSAKQKIKPRACNLCRDFFQPRSVFERFCHECKEQNELLRFSGCFPEIDEELLERIPAA